MKQFFIISIFLLTSVTTFAKDPLKGKVFATCDRHSSAVDIEYEVEYRKDNEELELEIYMTKEKAPCDGTPLFAIGRVWKYQIVGKELVTTLDRVKVMVVDKKIIPFFNEHRFCDTDDWKLEEMVSCAGLDIFGEESLPGHRTTHQFKLVKNKMIVTDDDGEKLELKAIK